MRKDALKKLLTLHSTTKAQVLATLLEKDYAEYADHHNITFTEVAGPLQKSGYSLDDRLKIKAESHHEDTDLFYRFITNKPFHAIKLEEKKSESRTLDKNRDDAVDNSLPAYLDAKDITNLSSCSFSLYQRTIKSTYWQEKLFTLNCNKEVLTKVIDAKVIENYKTLYRALLRFDDNSQKNLRAWEFYCLSGEPKAIFYATQHEGLTQKTKGWNDINALHWAAWGGSVAGMTYAVEVLKFAPDSRDNYGRNMLLLAAESGSVAAMTYAFKVLSKIAPDSCRNNNSKNALHYAAESGSVAAMTYAFEGLEIAPDSRNGRGANALHLAAESGSVATMKYAFEGLKLSPDSKDKYGRNALHYATYSSSVAAITYAVEVLKIAPDSKDNYGRNALHHATKSGSVKAVRCIRQLSDKFDTKLDPTVQDDIGHDAFWYADQSGESALLLEALTMPIEKLIGPSSNKESGNDSGITLEEKSSSHSLCTINSSSASSLSSPSGSSLLSASAFFSLSSSASSHDASQSSQSRSSGEPKEDNSEKENSNKGSSTLNITLGRQW